MANLPMVVAREARGWPPRADVPQDVELFLEAQFRRAWAQTLPGAVEQVEADLHFALLARQVLILIDFLYKIRWT